MKNLAILAVVLGALSNAAVAQSDVSELPGLTLAMNSNNASQWLVSSSKAAKPATGAFAEKTLSNISEQLSTKLEKQLEDRMTKELDYAAQ